jgi:hemolysin III
MGRFPVEPFNTASNLIFLAVIIYFTYKVCQSTRRHYFIKAIMPVFFIGYVGGTIYHATRSAEVWLLMDWVPIVVLCGACAIYFTFKATRGWTARIVLLTVILVLNIVPEWISFPVGYRTSIGYIATAIALLLPMVVYAYRTRWRRARFLGLTVLSFLLAVSFRTLDKKLDIEWLWMGTHWLWHLLGGVAVFWLMLYIYKDIERGQRLEK